MAEDSRGKMQPIYLQGRETEFKANMSFVRGGARDKPFLSYQWKSVSMFKKLRHCLLLKLKWKWQERNCDVIV